MLPEWFVYVGTLISFIGGLSYVRLTLLGKVQPNRLSWLLLTIVPMIAFFAALSEGVGKQVLLSFIVGFNPFMIFLASFVNKKAYWRLDRFDYYCGMLAIVAMIVWFLSGSGILAIIFSILADITAATPTARKAFKHPESESYIVFLFGFINAAIVLLTIDTWTFATYAFPLYILLGTSVLITIIVFPRDKLRRQTI
ncbi:hypothetical protein KA529_00655 [Candidatus Saccharibacteria bacterium]|nr:hypothetical protein [Candidatus Saccharibacteria bacterium]